ncbi:MAG: TIGR03088 family PEP-CTERM/XrtA system glycosyltransferase [Gammaproteobacteria bacterium]
MITIVHFIYQFSTGGLENGLVNIINHLPPSEFRHIVICLTTQTQFSSRLKPGNVEVIALDLKPGPLYTHYARILKLLKTLRADIVHTRNLGSIEIQLLAFLVGVPYRIHSEHGRGLNDLKGDNIKNQFLRKLMSPFIHQYVSLSKEIKEYLIQKVNINRKKVRQIYNGVNLEIFSPSIKQHDKIKIITVGRMEAVKDPLTTLEAIAGLVSTYPNIEFIVVGGGSMIPAIKAAARQKGIQNHVVCLGERDDISRLLTTSDIFVQSSLVEGISNTILEAMASGLPVVATDVGGNSELVEERVTGLLVPSQDVQQLKAALQYFCENKERRREYGLNGRLRVERHFSLKKMIEQYDKLYRIGLAA